MNAIRPELRGTLIFSLLGYLVNLGSSLISPILPLYAISFGVTVAMVGALVSASGVSRTVLNIPAGVVSERVGTKRFMLYGLGIVVASALISALAFSYWMLLFGLVMQGVGSAIYFTTSYIAICKIVPQQKRGKHLSFYISMQFLGSSSGPLLGGVVAQSFGLNAPFFFFGMVIATSIPAAYFGLREGPACSDEQGARQIELGQIGQVLGDYSLMAINIALLAISILRSGLISTVVPLFAYSELKLDPIQLGTVLTIMSVVNFLTILPAGSLSDRYGRRPFMFTSLILSGTLAIVLPFVQGLMQFTLVIAAMGFSLGLTGSIGAYVTDASKPSLLGTSLGVFRTVGDLGSVIGPIMLAALIPSYGSIGVLPFLLAGIILFASSIIILRAKDPVGDRNKVRRSVTLHRGS